MPANLGVHLQIQSQLIQLYPYFEARGYTLSALLSVGPHLPATPSCALGGRIGYSVRQLDNDRSYHQKVQKWKVIGALSSEDFGLLLGALSNWGSSETA